MNYLVKLFPVFLIGAVSTGYTQNAVIPATDSSEAKQLLKKIKLDLDEIDENGLIGPPDGKRAVAYEFCIPVNRKKRREVHKIDRSVQFQLGPTGRSGCSGQYLCIGNGGTKKVILRLARLEYIRQINPCYWE